MSSSPDPLTFVTSSSPSKAAATRRSAKRAAKPLAKLSPNVQATDPFLDLPELGNASPSKSMIMTTPKAAGSSPWRIKVTLEAEPDENFPQVENSPDSPTGRLSTRIATTTTSIPLNDVDGSSPVKRRGRPRKDDTPRAAALSDGVSPGKKRGRPRRTEAAIIGRTTSVQLNDAREESPARGMSRARKAGPTAAPGTTRSGTPLRRPRKSLTRSPEDNEVDSSLSDATYHPTKRSGARGRSSMSGGPAIAQPVGSATRYGLRSADDVDSEMEDVQNYLTTTTRASDLQLRRSSRATSQAVIIPDQPVDEDQEDSSEAMSSQDPTNDADMWRSMISNHVYESEETAEEEEETHGDDFDIVMSDQTVGEDTIRHSEEFSMVALHSLPSMQAARNGMVASGSQPGAPRHPPLRTDPLPQPHRRSLVGRAPLSAPPEINDSVASVTYMPSSPPVRFVASTSPKHDQNPNSPSAPPVPEQVEPSPPRADTPKLVDIVDADIALQGVVDGNNRDTQDRRPPDAIREDTQRARLNELSSQFQPGTRRELQAGLRLGEQLAERARLRTDSHEEPEQDAYGERTATPAGGGPSASERPTQDSSNHRLPTPEENDYSVPPPPPPPTSRDLNHKSDPAVAAVSTQLFSPPRTQPSPDAGDMQDDGARTPPSIGKENGQLSQTSHGNTLRSSLSEEDSGRQPRHNQSVGRDDDVASQNHVIELSSDSSEGSESTAIESSEDPLVSDIWEEEGSRDPNSRFARRARRVAAKRSGEKSSAGAGPPTIRGADTKRSPKRQPPALAPTRSTRPGSNRNTTLRRPRASERRSSRSQTSSRQECPEPTSTSDAGIEGESTDNTGLFWQRSSESPPRRPTQLESNKLDLSMLMAIVDSPAKDVPEPGLTSAPKLQPTRAPYNAGPSLNSPVKGSPLKQQVIFSSPSAVNSSPYQRIEHNIADSVVHDGDTMMVDGQDDRAQDLDASAPNGPQRLIPPSPAVFAEEDLLVQRQIHNELTPRSARIKNLKLSGDRRRLFTANDSAPQPEVSTDEQPSHLPQQFPKDPAKLPSHVDRNPPQLPARAGQPAEPSMLGKVSQMKALNLNKERRPLFEQNANPREMPAVQQKKQAAVLEQRPMLQPAQNGTGSVPEQLFQQPAQTQEQSSTGIFGRLWDAAVAPSEPEPLPLPLHPLARRYKHLPRLAPWTKTHWDTLDRIYQRYKRHPDQFSPDEPLHRALLAQKMQWQPDSTKMKPASDYAGVEMQRWGYTVKVTPELLVCCTIFMQLLTLRDAAEYRRVTGKDLVCGTFTQRDKPGDPITLRDVIARMFGVVGGELIRADERRGIRIRRDLDQFKLRYPWAPGWWDEMGNFA